MKHILHGLIPFAVTTLLLAVGFGLQQAYHRWGLPAVLGAIGAVLVFGYGVIVSMYDSDNG